MKKTNSGHKKVRWLNEKTDKRKSHQESLQFYGLVKKATENLCEKMRKKCENVRNL